MNSVILDIVSIGHSGITHCVLNPFLTRCDYNKKIKKNQDFFFK